MINSPTAILIDSDCGWQNTGAQTVKIFGKPSFTVSSKNGVIKSCSQDSETKYTTDPIEDIEKYLARGFTCVGYISYEFSGFTTPKFTVKTDKEGFSAYDTCFHCYEESQVEECSFDELLNRIDGNNNESARSKSRHLSNFKKSDYLKIVEKARRYISSGDIYQVNLSQKFSTSGLEDSYSSLIKFYEAQPVPFSALIEFDDHTVVSGSMELFLRRDGGKIGTKPIKGTAKRSKDLSTDRAIKKQLGENEKEKAENLMIVDLMRNDLGRICETGSVKVKELFRINEYMTLFQMESEIEGRLRENISLSEIISSTFPPGSVTGAPKSRALEIIDELEPHYRGPYCGALGVFYPDKDFVLSVAIRIMLALEGKTCYWVGGGIVWDSEPEKEYEETILKAKAIRKVLI